MAGAAVIAGVGVGLQAVGLISGKRSGKKSQAFAQQQAQQQFEQTQAFNAKILEAQQQAQAMAEGMAAAQAAQQEQFNSSMIAFQEQALAATRAAEEEARKRAEIANVRQKQQLSRASRIAHGDLQQSATTANAASSSAFAGAAASIAQQFVSGQSFLERSQQTVNKEVSANATAADFLHKADVVQVNARQSSLNAEIARSNFLASTDAKLRFAGNNFSALQNYNTARADARLTGIQNRADFNQNFFNLANKAFTAFA